MTPTEAVALAGYMRAHFPSQPIDDYTADALGELLEPYPLADGRAAVLRIAMRNHEGDTRQKWCTPTDVYAEVRRERAKRIRDHDPIEPPVGADPDDTAAYAAWLGRTRRMVADGNPPTTTSAAIEAPTRDVIRELGMAGTSVDEALSDKAERVKAAHREAKFILQAAPEPAPVPVFACEEQTTVDDGIEICGAPATSRRTSEGRAYPVCTHHTQATADAKTLSADEMETAR